MVPEESRARFQSHRKINGDCFNKLFDKNEILEVKEKSWKWKIEYKIIHIEN